MRRDVWSFGVLLAACAAVQIAQAAFDWPDEVMLLLGPIAWYEAVRSLMAPPDQVTGGDLGISGDPTPALELEGMAQRIEPWVEEPEPFTGWHRRVGEEEAISLTISSSSEEWKLERLPCGDLIARSGKSAYRLLSHNIPPLLTEDPAALGERTEERAKEPSPE